MVRHNATDRFVPGRWEVPGGRMLAEEDIDAAIRREVMEEAAVEIEPGPTFTMWSWEMPHADASSEPVRVVAVGRLCRCLSEPEPRLPDGPHSDQLDAIEWVPIDRVLSKDIIPNAREAFRTFVSIAGAPTYANWLR